MAVMDVVDVVLMQYANDLPESLDGSVVVKLSDEGCREKWSDEMAESSVE